MAFSLRLLCSIGLNLPFSVYLPGYVSNSSEELILSNFDCSSDPKISEVVRKKSSTLWLKLNTDGLSKGNPVCAAGDGLFRDLVVFIPLGVHDLEGLHTTLHVPILVMILFLKIQTHIERLCACLIKIC